MQDEVLEAPVVDGEDTEAILDEVIAACAEDSAEAQEYQDRLKQELRSKADKFESMIEHEEELRLGDDGWKARYYEQKFGISEGPEQEELISKLSTAFVEGLCWVMRYYFDGVASWRWFYPFHYAPFASDLVRLDEMQVRPSAVCKSRKERNQARHSYSVQLYYDMWNQARHSYSVQLYYDMLKCVKMSRVHVMCDMRHG
jgi:5'-3' exonuclease